MCTPILVGTSINVGGHGLSGFRDIATFFEKWQIIVNPLFLSLPLSFLLLLLYLLTDYITDSLISLNDITISLQLHTDQQMHD